MDSGRSSKKPFLEVYPRKRAMHAILKYGNACVLSSGGGSAQIKTWCKPPLTRWRKFEKKVAVALFQAEVMEGLLITKQMDLFFWQVFNEKKRSSLWRNTHFHHFRGPATLPAGYFCMHCTFTWVFSKIRDIKNQTKWANQMGKSGRY